MGEKKPVSGLRVPKGVSKTVPVEHAPRTLQETLREMVDREIRYRERLRRDGHQKVDDGLGDIDLLGEEEDLDELNLTESERQFALAQLEAAARFREDRARRQKLIEERQLKKLPPKEEPSPQPKEGDKAGK